MAVRIAETALVAEQGHESTGDMEHVLRLLGAPPTVLRVSRALVVGHEVKVHRCGVHHVAERVVQRSVSRTVQRDIGVPVHVAAIDLVGLSAGVDGVVANGGDLLGLAGLRRQHGRWLRAPRPEDRGSHSLVTELRGEFGEKDLVLLWVVAEPRPAPELLVSRPRSEQLPVAARDRVERSFVAAHALGDAERLRPFAALVIGGHDRPLASRGPQRLRLDGPHPWSKQQPHASLRIQHELRCLHVPANPRAEAPVDVIQRGQPFRSVPDGNSIGPRLVNPGASSQQETGVLAPVLFRLVVRDPHSVFGIDRNAGSAVVAGRIGHAHQLAGPPFGNRTKPDVVAAALVAVPGHPGGAPRIRRDARIPLVSVRAGVAERHFCGPVGLVARFVIDRGKPAPRRLPRKVQLAVRVACQSGKQVVPRLGHDHLRRTPTAVGPLGVHQAPAYAEPLRPNQVESAAPVVRRFEPLQVPGCALHGDDLAPVVT